MNLHALGWNGYFEKRFEDTKRNDDVPVRVVQEHRDRYVVCGEAGELDAELSGKLRHQAESRGELPAVGDWVAATVRPREGRATIHRVLPRKSGFVRKTAGIETVEQVLVANVDTVFLVSGLDGDFNVRRLERYLTLAWESGANPVLVLNKADVCGDVAARMAQVEEVAFGVPIHAMSGTKGEGVTALEAYCRPGQTVAFLGSSGVGKSTLINALLGEERMTVTAVREDDSRGRHTTTHRELIVMPSGGIVIDTPGLRELQLWGDEESLSQSFRDVAAIGMNCRFSDCLHEGEPDCAVLSAVAEGRLERRRYESYLKLRRELKFLERRQQHKDSKRTRFKNVKRQGQLARRLKHGKYGGDR